MLCYSCLLHASLLTDRLSCACVQDTAVILGREQTRLQEELQLTRRQVSQIAHVMQARLAACSAHCV